MNEKQLNERVQAERLAHTQNDVLKNSYALKNRLKHIWSYPSRAIFDNEFHKHLKSIEGLTILDYGCGRGQESIKYLDRGATVYGIDISDTYINECNERAKNYPEHQYRFSVMDAHKLQFPDNTFDLIAGNGILHHLDPIVAMNEIYRVLKPGGRVLLQEPLAGNPLLRLFRFLTPSARTEDEKPFSKKDINDIVNCGNWHVQSYYCGLVEAPLSVLTSILMPSKPNNAILSLAHALESNFRKRGWLNSWHQYVLFNLVKQD